MKTLYPAIKRFTDVLLSGLGMILLSPLFLVIGIVIKLTSPGAVFFRQKRVGAGKKLFMMYKFRTMRSDAPSDIPTHLLKDPFAYITGIGKILRRTSMDELPQLWNIFTGDMSLIGPRPALYNQYDLIALRDEYKANDIRPGLTGLAQISGRDELPISQKAALDGEYREKMGFGMDCRILLLTLKLALTGQGVSEGGPR